ncbi:acyl-CoA dehydrogenase [Bradyrhizobium sp. A11]|uniref:acyl-CoA dehydrogenase family protein n=1 Tax=Bradyrhizobium sp. A11 TaxID=3133974 RepID=UPI00324AD449
MVDFSLTDADKKIAALARDEAEIGRTYSRYYDKHEDEIEPKVFAEVKDRPDPLEMLDAIEAETSGRVIVEHLVTMETARGDVRMRRIKKHLGDKIVRYAGNDEQRKLFGNKLLSIALTEPGAGSDPSMIRGSARYDEATDEWILNAEKIYCSAFGASDGALVLVRGQEKNGARPFMGFVIEKGMKGLTELGQVKKMGIRSWDTADFVLQDCRVPSINKIDVDFKKTMIVFNGTRPGVAAMGLAVAGSLLEFTREKLLGKEQVLDYAKGIRARSAIEDRLIRMEALYEATSLTILRCKWLEHVGGTNNGATKVEAAMSKALGGKAARKITQGCMELLGPEGLSEEYLAEKWFRDARIFDIFEGAGDVNRLIVARSLLDYSQKELN